MMYVVSECAERPVASSLRERCVDDTVAVASDERDLEPNTASLVTGVSVLVIVWTVHPMTIGEKRCDPIAVVPPHCDIEIAVLSSDFADVEVDGPSSEKPIADLLELKGNVDISQSRQLRQFTVIRHYTSRIPWMFAY
jgi:hypothetical protein